MKATNSNIKYRLLVPIDLSKGSEIVLKNAVQLAKVINGKVEVLYVKAPIDVVKSENQFSAMRMIHEDHNFSKSKLKRIIRKIESENDVPITYQMAYGNIKKSIIDHVSKGKPDIVLLGKQKNSLISFFKLDIVSSLLKHSSVNLLILGEDHKFHSFSDVSLGIYNEALEHSGFQIINDLNEKGNNPIQFFSIGSRKDSQKNAEDPQNEQRAISYVFSEGANAFDNLTTYVSKTNTQLFCISDKYGNNRHLQKLNIPVLILR